MMLKTEHIQTLMPVIDAAIRSAGVQVFQNNGGVKLQEVLDILQKIVDEENKGEN